MRYLFKARTQLDVEWRDHQPPNLYRMQALKSNQIPATPTKRVSQSKLKALKLLEEKTKEVLSPRHCIIPPAPTPSEAGEFLSLEFQMMSLPVLQRVDIDDVVALARVNEVNLQDIQDALVEMNIDKDTVASNDAQTVIPGSPGSEK